MKKSARKNVADAVESLVDGLIIDKVCQLLFKMSTIVGSKALQTAEEISKNIPPHLKDSTFHTVQTTAGQFTVIVDSTGESLSVAVAVQKALNLAEKIVANTTKANELSKKLNELTQPNPDDVKAFQKSIEPYLNSEKIIDVKRLQSIEGIEQIDKFKKYTNNFTDLAKLTPEEILYLNVCDWLEPQAAKINARLKQIGGIKVIDPTTQAEALIEKYDLFHSLLGEMKPQFLNDVTSGGHLPLIELRSAILEIGKIKPIGNGFFDMAIKRGSNRKINSYFPVGKSVEQCVNMIEDAIVNFKEIKVADDIKNQLLQGFIITNQQDQKFMIMIEDKIAQFYPYKPKI